VGTGEGPVHIPRKELKSLLEIDNTIADSTSKSLQIAFAKYKACNAAVQVYDTLIADGEWPDDYHRVTVTEIRQLFVSKSVWHAQYALCFQDITSHGDMLAWLENSPTALDDEELWGEEKAIYHFSDLKEWLKKKKKANKKEKTKGKKVVKKTDDSATKKKK
jgi:hypothetical protein